MNALAQGVEDGANVQEQDDVHHVQREPVQVPHLRNKGITPALHTCLEGPLNVVAGIRRYGNGQLGRSRNLGRQAVMETHMEVVQDCEQVAHDVGHLCKHVVGCT